MLVGMTIVLMLAGVGSVKTVIIKNQTSLFLMEDSLVRLACRTERSWFFCLWNSPHMEQSCAIQHESPTSVCSKTNRTKILGQRNSCDLEVQVIVCYA